MDDLNEEERSGPIAARSPKPGRHSPYRDRSVAENLDLFAAHALSGEFGDGAKVLRAKIDIGPLT